MKYVIRPILSWRVYIYNMYIICIMCVYLSFNTNHYQIITNLYIYIIIYIYVTGPNEGVKTYVAKWQRQQQLRLQRKLWHPRSYEKGEAFASTSIHHKIGAQVD